MDKRKRFNLFNDDCLKVLKSIKDNSIDCVISDVPYKLITGGVSTKIKENTSGMLKRVKEKDPLKYKWKQSNLVREGKLFKHNNIQFSDFMPELYRVLKEKTHCYIMVNDRNLNNMINASLEAGFKLVNILVWKKNNATPNKFYMKNCEFIIMLRKGKERWINNMGSKAVLEFDNIIGKKVHPTEKPVDLNEFLITNSTNEGEIVLDPFMGSGSCGVACKNTKRKFVGIELDEDYFKIAKERIENE